MDTLLPSALVAVIGLIGPVLVYLNGRFSGPAARASRLESISKSLDSLVPMSTEHIVLSLVRKKLILDEHYKTLGPQLYKYVLILSFITSGIGIIAALNIWFEFADQYMTLIVTAQVGMVIVQSGLTITQNRQHDRYEKKLMADVAKSAAALTSSPQTESATE